jgi:hypothetical protein
LLLAVLSSGAGIAKTETSSLDAFVAELVDGLIGEWKDEYTVELTLAGWRDYGMDFINRVEKLDDTHLRIHRVNGPPPLDVEFSPPILRVFWPNGDGEIELVTESHIERLDVHGPMDWSLLIRTEWNGQDIWMEMVLSGDVFTYFRWHESPDRDRRYTRLHWMKRVPD